MQTTQRRRGISSCIPCYTKKQKCNRRYPCNHCTHRRRPEQCVFQTPEGVRPASPPLRTDDRRDEVFQNRDNQRGNSASKDSLGPLPDLTKTGSLSNKQCSPTLAELFGYFEDSGSNTMALVRKIGVREEEENNTGGQTLPQEVAVLVQQSIDEIPDRRILDFLVDYFVAEINWMDQLVYAPWFLAQYQKWWNIRGVSNLLDVEFTVLLLRTCSYASQFLPSPSHTVDRVRGMLLADISKSCDIIANSLAAICTHLDSRGSLLRVQHIAFAGLKSMCEGRTNTFLEELGYAIRVAQKVGIHRDAMNELEKEMRRMTFCNLYVWNSLLSRQLDRIPFFPAGLSSQNMPRMHLIPNADDAADAPKKFTERVLQARLANFWRQFNSEETVTEYDMIVAKERYRRMCSEFLTTLPSAFALHPNKQWDQRLPMLHLQRQVLHINIFDSLCYNFRPALIQEPSHVRDLPKYKQILLSTQRKALAVAALSVLDNVSTLHGSMGNSHTRFVGIIFPSFEAAVLLVSLCLDVCFPEENGEGNNSGSKLDPLGAGMLRVTRGNCMQAVQEALSRLRTLADVSEMADIGAQTLSQMIEKATTSSTTTAQATEPLAQVCQAQDQMVDISDCMQLAENSTLDIIPDFLSVGMCNDVSSNWEALVEDFNIVSDFELSSSSLGSS